MRRHLASFALFASVIAGPAFAADMPLKAPPPVVYGWDGFYLGVQAGGQWNNNSWTTNCIDAGGPPLGGCGSPFSNFIFPHLDGTQNPSLNNSTGRVGAYFGAVTTIWNRWVVGGELNWGFYNKSTTIAGIPGCSTPGCSLGLVPPFGIAGDFARITNWGDAAALARFGFLATPNVLFYVTGGPAITGVDATLACTVPPLPAPASPACGFTHQQTTSSLLAGWTAGGGLEWRPWQHLVLRAEYRYAEYGSLSHTFFQNSGDLEVLTNIKVKQQMVNVGVAFMIPPIFGQ
jgi:outer membrane immunogenic protein